jgi:diadenosine tetraphosphate (Ap4A) HIT family hydrolase
MSGDCIFCRPDDETVNTVIASNTDAYVRLDNFPLAPGHVEVVPVRHVGSVFDLSPQENASIWDLAHEIRGALGPCDGYSIGINDGAAAGQTIPHMHLHIIPRHLGDVPEPRGGIRRIFPNDSYSAAKQ